MVKDEQVDGCPSEDYKEGAPSGKCWGDGHYRCKTCQHYRADFAKHGQDYKDFAHQIQGQVQFYCMSDENTI